MEGLHFGLHFLCFPKIRLETRSILSGIKNQIDSIKTHLYIQKWSALTEIFKKVIGHFDFWAWKWSSRAPKIKFSQYVNSRELKKFSRIAMTLFFSSESWQSRFFKYVKIGAQNGAPELQFHIDWKKFNLSFTQILRVFLAVGLQGLQKRLHLCMSKSAHESSCSIQSLKMKFWMIFKLAGSKNMDFSNFEAGPRGIGNCGGSILGSKVWKMPPS